LEENTMTDQTFATHLECSETGKRYAVDEVHGLSEAGKPLLVRYDLGALADGIKKSDIADASAPGFWRYASFLPVEQARNRVSLGEVVTPIVPLRTFGANLSMKDEGRLPTGSFKARGLALAVSRARELGIAHLAMPTNGNAGAALSAYAAQAGLRATVFCPADTPEINVRETAATGADVYRVDGLINDCGKYVQRGKESQGWFDTSTLKEPYRIEGKKTMGLELAEQLGWRLPEAIFYPTGGGTGLIGMWKAFHELREIGWLDGPLPKMVAVQASGCAPIVRAWQNGDRHAELWQDARTFAAGIRVPAAVGDFLILDAIRQSGGWATAIDDDAIAEARDRVAEQTGNLLCPEGAATFAAWEEAVATGHLAADAEAVLFNCATGLKYPLPDRAYRAEGTIVV
jgi:threonine synthase